MPKDTSAAVTGSSLKCHGQQLLEGGRRNTMSSGAKPEDNWIQKFGLQRRFFSDREKNTEKKQHKGNSNILPLLPSSLGFQMTQMDIYINHLTSKRRTLTATIGKGREPKGMFENCLQFLKEG